MERNMLNRPKTGSRRSPSPKRLISETDNENSPVQIACTQESSDNIDVVWDWNSPQAKKHPRKCQKRLLVQSPKVPLKRHPSINSVQDFEKLQEELKCLREELAMPDHEESLLLSPVEEAEYKGFNNDCTIHQIQEDEFDELMDENVNEQLFAFSQQIEEDWKMMESKKSPQNSPFNTKMSPNVKFRKTSTKEKEMANDSFEDLLKTVDIDEFKDSPERVNVSNGSTLSYKSVDRVVVNSVQTKSGKFEFHRTQSFEMANNECGEKNSVVCTQDQIEKKRLEALAKLEAKKKKNIVNTQFSEEEIERKRSEALAKIEAKRQQDIIEQKRLEALKKLQMKRQQNATAVRSSLVTRLK